MLCNCSLGDGCSFPTCLVNQDPEQPTTPSGHNSTAKKYLLIYYMIPCGFGDFQNRCGFFPNSVT